MDLDEWSQPHGTGYECTVTDLWETYQVPVYIAGHMQGPSMLDLCRGRGMVENCPMVHIYISIIESTPGAFKEPNYRPLGRHESRFEPPDLSNLQHMLCVAVVLHGLWQGFDISILPIDLDLELYAIPHLKSASPKRCAVRLWM